MQHCNRRRQLRRSAMPQPQRTSSSRSEIIRGTLQRILRRRESLRSGSGTVARRAIATAKVEASSLVATSVHQHHHGDSPTSNTETARSPAKAFEFLVSPRSLMNSGGGANRQSSSSPSAAQKARAAAAQAAAQAAALSSSSSSAAAGREASGDARAPLALMSDFSQALEDKNWVREPNCQACSPNVRAPSPRCCC